MPRNHLLAVEEAESIQVLEDYISNVPQLVDYCVTQNIEILMKSLLDQVSVPWSDIPRTIILYYYIF